MKAREFLAANGYEVRPRNFFTQPLSAEEITDLGARLGGVGLLVAPTRREEVDGLTPDEIVAYLAEDPKRLRRPVIEIDGRYWAGFNKKVQKELADL